ncbi:MAG TPA: GtrA family protein [Rhodanobacteraceae bacterium]
MNLLAQGVRFVLVGCGLIVVDWLVFVVLTWMSLAPVYANVAGRVAGALVGFWANGRFTFAVSGQRRSGRARFARFASAWCVLTVLSTVLMMFLAAHLGLHRAWLAKPVVEAGLALASFFVSRHWVYR